MTEQNSAQHLGQDNTIVEQSQIIKGQDKTILRQYHIIKERDKTIKELKAELERYKKNELKCVDCWVEKERVLSPPKKKDLRPRPTIKPILNSENKLIYYVVETKAGTKTELQESLIKDLLDDEFIVKRRDPNRPTHYLENEFEFKSMEFYESYMEAVYDGLHWYDDEWRKDGRKPWLP